MTTPKGNILRARIIPRQGCVSRKREDTSSRAASSPALSTALISLETIEKSWGRPGKEAIRCPGVSIGFPDPREKLPFSRLGTRVWGWDYPGVQYLISFPDPSHIGLETRLSSTLTLASSPGLPQAALCHF